MEGLNKEKKSKTYAVPGAAAKVPASALVDCVAWVTVGDGRDDCFVVSRQLPLSFMSNLMNPRPRSLPQENVPVLLNTSKYSLLAW